jgi:hypothetical protein
MTQARTTLATLPVSFPDPTVRSHSTANFRVGLNPLP